MSTNNLKVSDQIISFMLAEMDMLTTRWTDANQIAEGRMNLFITITSGAVGLLLVITQLNLPAKTTADLSIVVFLFIWLLGILTFRRMLERNLLVVRYIRAVNRVRRFFVDVDCRVIPYLMFPPSDDWPDYRDQENRRFGARTVSAMVCSLAFGAMMGTSVYYFLTSAQSVPLSILAGSGSLLLHLVALERYAYIRFIDQARSTSIMFPASSLESKTRNPTSVDW